MAHALPHHQTVASVGCGVITVSDTRTPGDDVSGQLAVTLLRAAGHVVRHYGIVPDDPLRITACLEGWLDDPLVQAVVTTGGTGLARRDTTLEAVRPLLDKEIPGFGELFRSLSYAVIGPAAMLSRATAGVTRGRIVIVLPGSAAAVDLAMQKLVLPALGHMVSVVTDS
jgi:molybdenum cofactor biosynthesis protein B